MTTGTIRVVSRGTSTVELQHATAGKFAVPDQATARSAIAGQHLNPPGGGFQAIKSDEETFQKRF